MPARSDRYKFICLDSVVVLETEWSLVTPDDDGHVLGHGSLEVHLNDHCELLSCFHLERCQSSASVLERFLADADNLNYVLPLSSDGAILALSWITSLVPGVC